MDEHSMWEGLEGEVTHRTVEDRICLQASLAKWKGGLHASGTGREGD